MNQIRPWLYIGRYSGTTDLLLLEFYQISAMLQLAGRVEQPGISRSSTFAIATLKEIEQVSLLVAFREVKTRHPLTFPHPALWQSLCDYFNEYIPFSRLLSFK